MAKAASENKAAEFQASQERWRTALGFVKTEKSRPLAGRTILVAMALQTFENRQSRQAFPGQVTLGRRAGIGGADSTVEREVRKHLGILESAGMIVRGSKPFGGSVRYTFTVPESVGAEMDAAQSGGTSPLIEADSNPGTHLPAPIRGHVSPPNPVERLPSQSGGTSPRVTSDEPSIKETSDIEPPSADEPGDVGGTGQAEDAGEDLDDEYFNHLPEPEDQPSPSEGDQTETENDVLTPQQQKQWMQDCDEAFSALAPADRSVRRSSVAEKPDERTGRSAPAGDKKGSPAPALSGDVWADAPKPGDQPF